MGIRWLFFILFVFVLSFGFQNCVRVSGSSVQSRVSADLSSESDSSTGSSAAVIAIENVGAPVIFGSDWRGVQPSEIPPSIVMDPAGDKATVFHSTYFSTRCEIDRGHSLLAPGAFVQGANCDIDTSPLISDYIWSHRDAPLEQPETDAKRSYNGVFSAHRIDNRIVTINHGENKNWVNPTGQDPALCSRNTVKPEISCYASPALADLGCASGLYGGQWIDCLESYHSFVTISSRIRSQSTVYDFGPIVWPADGYVKSNGVFSTGVRHPSSIVHDGYLYVFYADLSVSAEPGRGPGIKVARAPLITDGVGAFKTYFKCADENETCFSEMALPQGFTLSSIRSYYGRVGGRSTDILESTRVTRPDLVNRFSVAKLANEKGFIGVSLEDGRVYLRHSHDLLHWSRASEVESLSTNGLTTDTKFLYVNFLGASGSDHHLIDQNDFYLIGTSLDGVLYSSRLSIKVRP